MDNIYVSNPTAAPVEVAFCDNDAVPLLNITVSAYDSDNFMGPWVADNGLHVLGLGDEDVIVTVSHGADGA